MVPDDEPKTQSDQPPQGETQPAVRRRSRRGGRRHARRRGPRPDVAPADAPAASLPPEEPVATAAPIDEPAAAEDADAGESVEAVEFAESTEQFHAREPDPSRPEPARPEPPPQREPEPFAVSKAIDQVNYIIEDLKKVLGEMEELLETLELAERQKIDDERELESLQRALRRLHHPREGGHHRH
jgi:hypothetical protein